MSSVMSRCPDCKGTGKMPDGSMCDNCDGSGMVVKQGT